jgi:ABC-2 type transport system permease protein
MEILKASTDWAKDEVFSSKFLMLLGILFLLATIGFWQLGKTTTAKAFVLPIFVASLLILAGGVGLFITNKKRVTSFETAYYANPRAFVQSKIIRTEKSLNQYKIIVFKIIPLIIIVAALIIIFVDKPMWRAIGITTIATMVVILFVDGNANARIQAYHQRLLVEMNDLK